MSKRSISLVQLGGPPEPIDYLIKRPSSSGTTEPSNLVASPNPATENSSFQPAASANSISATSCHGSEPSTNGSYVKPENSSSSGDVTPLEFRPRNYSSGASKNDKLDPPARERPLDGLWPARDTLSFTRFLMFYGEGTATEEHETACKYILEARNIRKKYHGSGSTSIDADLLDAVNGTDDDQLKSRMGPCGVMEIYSGSVPDGMVFVPSIEEFTKDYNRLVTICTDGMMRSFCFQRLQLLSTAFKMHITANGQVENEAQSNLLGTDFYRTMKIDNHIHLAAAASAKQFVSFVKNKIDHEGDTVVLENGQTLRQVFLEAGLNCEHLTIDHFNILADYSVYQRFDNFNNKYSPFRLAQMRKIFLKVENITEGRFFAELTKNVLSRLEHSKGHNSAAEMRLSIYGMERTEWAQLAKWILKDWQFPEFPGPILSSHNRWLIQIPRLWRIYCSKGKAINQERHFQDMLSNLFCPIFDATLHPNDHPEVAELLKHIVGFDSVDDEGAHESSCNGSLPSMWTQDSNPEYCWQLYFLWANIEVLNAIRKSKGLNTFALRPHAGETGDVMHLATTYILSQSINHGINLEHQVSLQYLYYLDQIGLSISPLSNNFLFRKIAENPFPKLFRRGLNVTLSTDDPLLFHLSDDALLEEYSVARATFDLSMTDLSEIARNSIFISGFEDHLKRKWLGDDFEKGITFCDEALTHVPLIRAKYRAEHLALEHMIVNLISAGKGKEVLRDMMVHFGLARDAHRDILLEHLPSVPSFPEQNQL